MHHARPWTCSNGKSVTCRPALVSAWAWSGTALHLWVEEAIHDLQAPLSLCLFPRVSAWPGAQYLCHLPKPLLPPAAWNHLCAGTLPAWL